MTSHADIPACLSTLEYAVVSENHSAARPSAAASSSSSLPAASSPGSARRGFALLTAAGVLWGTGGLAGHLLQADGVPPLAVAAYRLLVAGALITAFLAAAGRLGRLPRSRPPAVRLAANALLHAVFQSLYFASLAFIPVGLATLVKIGSVPVFVAVGICLAARRVPSRRLAAAVLLAVAGLALLAGFPAGDAPPLTLALGLACALGAGLTFSVMTLLNRAPVAGLDPLVNVGVGLLAGGLLLLPAGLVAGMAVPARPLPLALLVFLGLVPTALAYLAYFGGLRTASDAGAAVGTIAEPLTAAVLSMVLLGEQMTAAGAVGAVLLLAAMGVDQAAEALRRRRSG
ncbi:DMT family transporter [Streptomonospora nanhaiensis]|uniref:DME family drug/metabolite transporter n=1 Tax=Streptomonospora nanhaiensis TaxID=1323731 RepID=A0A853BUG6_9ACTN|nr:DMT family transporter [Streptomonospora nanhaiensis]NYI98157.1 DME family drug/metabolite transporter [Streptomonospora nanhaiensis]